MFYFLNCNAVCHIILICCFSFLLFSVCVVCEFPFSHIVIYHNNKQTLLFCFVILFSHTVIYHINQQQNILHWTEYPPDAHRGFNIPSGVFSFTSTATAGAAAGTKTKNKKQKERRKKKEISNRKLQNTFIMFRGAAGGTKPQQARQKENYIAYLLCVSHNNL